MMVLGRGVGSVANNEDNALLTSPDAKRWLDVASLRLFNISRRTSDSTTGSGPIWAIASRAARRRCCSCEGR